MICAWAPNARLSLGPGWLASPASLKQGTGRYAGAGSHPGRPRTWTSGRQCRLGSGTGRTAGQPRHQQAGRTRGGRRCRWRQPPATWAVHLLLLSPRPIGQGWKCTTRGKCFSQGGAGCPGRPAVMSMSAAFTRRTGCCSPGTHEWTAYTAAAATPSGLAVGYLGCSCSSNTGTVWPSQQLGGAAASDGSGST